MTAIEKGKKSMSQVGSTELLWMKEGDVEFTSFLDKWFSPEPEGGDLGKAGEVTGAYEGALSALTERLDALKSNLAVKLRIGLDRKLQEKAVVEAAEDPRTKAFEETCIKYGQTPKGIMDVYRLVFDKTVNNWRLSETEEGKQRMLKIKDIVVTRVVANMIGASKKGSAQ